MTLYEAATRGDVDAVRRLLDGGAEADAPNEYENTPLMEAASHGRTEIVRMLLEAGADPRRLNSLALDFAVRLGNADCVRLLLAAGADPDRSDPDEDEDETDDPPPLFEAVGRNNLPMTRMLIEAGARLDVVAGGWGLLSVALRHENPELFELLWGRKASPHGALRAVAETGRVAYLERLLALGLDIDEAGSDGSTPLALAAYYGRTTMVERLIAAGADKERRDQFGKTPLGQAISEGKAASARALLAAGASLDGEEDGSLLETAIWSQGSAKLVRLLLEHGADPDEARRQRPAPLFWAVDAKRPKIVAALLAAGADPNVRIESRGRHGLAGKLVPGTTPLMYAARKGSSAIVDLLLRSGADPKPLDSKGRSAADLAAKAGRLELSDRLAGAGSPLSLAPRATQLRRAEAGDPGA